MTKEGLADLKEQYTEAQGQPHDHRHDWEVEEDLRREHMLGVMRDE